MPDTLKGSIISPVPEVCPPQNIKSDLRPIVLTICLTNKRLSGQVSDTIDPRQYARHGHSTVHALIYLMQAIHEAVVQETVLFGYFLQILLKVLMS